MKLNELTFTSGARYVAKRKCRGLGSGKGKNGISTPTIRAIFHFLLKLTLSLFVLWINTNDHNFAISFNNFALITNWFY